MTVQQDNLAYKGGREGIDRVSMEKDSGETSKGSVPPSRRQSTSSTESLSLLDPRHPYNNENSDSDDDLHRLYMDAARRLEELRSEFKASTSKVKYDSTPKYHCLDQLVKDRVAESEHKVKSSPSRKPSKHSTSRSIDSYFKRYRVSGVTSEWLGGCRCGEAQDIDCSYHYYHQEPIDDSQLSNQGTGSSNQTPSRDHHKVLSDEDVAWMMLLDERGDSDYLVSVRTREKKDRRMFSEEGGYVHVEMEWNEMEDIDIKGED